MRRREFLETARWGIAAGSIAGMAAPHWPVGQAIAADGYPATLEIIDCHTHFYDPSRPEGVPWPGKGTSLYRTVLPKDLRAVEVFKPLTGTIVVEASPWVEDNAWLLELAARDPFIVGVVGNLQVGHPEFATRLKRFAADKRFRGIRVSSSLVKEHVERGEWGDFQRLSEANLALDVNGGPDTPAILARLAPRVPDLRIVLNHIGNVRISADAPPADWRTGIAAAARQPNVFCKISALVEGAARDGQSAPSDLDFYHPYLDAVWEPFGDERVIYGSNWPVSERAATYASLQKITLEYAKARGAAALRNFCAGNSQRAYRWRPS
jgi:predicted TIM-barrel fold metal-dependent hydrolase